MADDIMELSSERHVEEEFDFDFDLTVPTEDEDVMLEDSDNREIYTLVDNQPSAAVSNDDPMVDDDNEGTYEMSDSEPLPDDMERPLDHDSMSFAPGYDLDFDQTAQAVMESGNDDNVSQATAFKQHQDDQQQYEATGNDTQLQLACESFNNHGNQGPVTIEAAAVANSSNAEFPTDAQETSREDKLSEPIVEASRTPSSNSNVSDDAPTDRNPDSNIVGPAVRASPDHEQKTWSDVDSEVVLTTTEVMVLYQSNTYALFSTSELDDPDSFFLTDGSIVHKPLSKLFGAIREVIHEDLGDEGELVMCFPDLGLETEEVSSSIQDVTLAYIINLRAKLLLNDGVDIEQTLHIELGIRKSFRSLLSKITTDADNGKGLSEIVTWDENSDSSDKLSPQRISSNTLESEGRTKIEQHKNQDEQCASGTKPQQEQEFYGGTDQTAESIKTSTQDPDSVNEPAVLDLEPSEAKLATNIEVVSEGSYVEDGDIIDYSDDELDQPLRFSLASEQVHIEKRTEDLDVTSEAFRYHSVAHVGESKRCTQNSKENDLHHEIGATQNKLQEKDADFKRNNDEYQKRNDEKYEQFSAINRSEFADALQDDVHENYDSESNGGLATTGDYGDEEEEGIDEHVVEGDENLSIRGDSKSTGNNHQHIDLAIELATSVSPGHFGTTSSATMSADEIHNGNINYIPQEPRKTKADDEDEIDYDDDEEVEITKEAILPIEAQATPQDLRSLKGKRSITDVEHDDSSDNKETKRPRSR